MFDNEVLHKKRINRTFALAAKPVTVGQYQRFDKNYTFIERYAPKPSCPVSSISWYQAAAYCNWLSEKEGIPKEEWGYETTPQGQVTKLKENYLSLTGYRLPTEAEWEYGCRAGSVTSRYYGESEELLGKYAWYLSNSLDRTWPVGTKKPNDLGLFDLHGNVWCWCQESQKAYPEVTNQEVIEDKEDVLSIVSTTRRILRGGALNTNGLFIRSANRYWNVPTYPGANVGFRPARTLR